MLRWLKKAPDKTSYQRRLAVWLTHNEKLHAHQISRMLGVSTQAVWQWIRTYNQHGPDRLIKRPKGGRHWAFLGYQTEAEIIQELLRLARIGPKPSAKEARQLIETRLGRHVSLSYVYRFLNRHDWKEISAKIKPARSVRQGADDFRKLTRPWLRYQ
jgi:transposase